MAEIKTKTLKGQKPKQQEHLTIGSIQQYRGPQGPQGPPGPPGAPGLSEMTIRERADKIDVVKDFEIIQTTNQHFQIETTDVYHSEQHSYPLSNGDRVITGEQPNGQKIVIARYNKPSGFTLKTQYDRTEFGEPIPLSFPVEVGVANFERWQGKQEFGAGSSKPQGIYCNPNAGYLIQFDVNFELQATVGDQTQSRNDLIDWVITKTCDNGITNNKIISGCAVGSDTSLPKKRLYSNHITEVAEAYGVSSNVSMNTTDFLEPNKENSPWRYEVNYKIHSGQTDAKYKLIIWNMNLSVIRFL